MNSENFSDIDSSSERFGNVLEENKGKFGKMVTYLFSSSKPMSAADKVGLTLTIIAFGFILTPIAMSDSDPYHLKGILEEVKDNVLSIDNFDNNQDKSEYRIIAHLKLSPEFHLDSTEKIIQWKYHPKNI